MSIKAGIELRPDDQPPRPHKPNEMDAMDEIVATGVSIQIERMSDKLIYGKIEAVPNGATVHVSIWAKGGKLYFGAEEE